MQTYIFPAQIEVEDDGRWSAWIVALPGCPTWGYTQQEALDALQEAAQAYIEVLLEKGHPLPIEFASDATEVPMVAVTV